MLLWDRASMREFAVRYPKLLDNALSIAADYLNMSIAAQVALSATPRGSDWLRSWSTSPVESVAESVAELN